MNLTLIGMAGAGKSTIGIKLAKSLNLNFIDTDSLIEQTQHKQLSLILKEVGSKAFREIEEKIILNLKLDNQTLISTGGSVIYNEKSITYLKKYSKIIFLDVPFEIIEERIQHNPRGIVGLENKTLKDIYLERRPLYMNAADISIEASNKTVEEITSEIINKISNNFDSSNF